MTDVVAQSFRTDDNVIQIDEIILTLELCKDKTSARWKQGGALFNPNGKRMNWNVST